MARATFQQTDQFYRPDYNDFSPRIGVAWDIFGTGGRSSGAVTACSTIAISATRSSTRFRIRQTTPWLISPPRQLSRIMPNQFDTIIAAGGSTPITSSARMLDNDLRTAYSAQFNATLERDLGRGFIGSISYLGANGIKLYSLNDLNQLGSCVFLQQIDPTFPC